MNNDNFAFFNTRHLKAKNDGKLSKWEILKVNGVNFEK